MNTASLKIKFTPLMKKVHVDDSTCCLEIVPEVSELNNFDKIKWKKEKSFYEYHIPMNYKIILKRRENNDVDKREGNDSPNPMYHSCVDLLHPSVTSYSLASGDVNKTLSDNYILSKVMSDLDCCNIILSQHKEMCCSKKVKAKVSASVQTVDAWNKDNATISDIILDGQQNQKSVANQIDAQADSSNEIIDSVKKLKDKGTLAIDNTFSALPVAENISSDDTINRILAERMPIESLRRLSVSPICSINTDISPLPHENSFFSNSFLSREFDPSKDLAIFRNLSPIPRQTFNVYTTSINVDNYKPQTCATFRKLNPEERIEQFMKLMEKEIMPLKHMLNDIIARYSAIEKAPNFFNDTNFNRNQYLNKIEEIKEIEGPDEQIRSNRVVFNVVFDG